MSKPSSGSASKPPALFLAAEAPYPTIGGGPIRASSVLEYLAQRFSVHAIFFLDANRKTGQFFGRGGECGCGEEEWGGEEKLGVHRAPEGS